MKAQDWMSQDNNRAEAIRLLLAFCDLHNFEYRYNADAFAIKLPEIEPIPVMQLARASRSTAVHGLDTSRWSEPGPVEGDLPPATEPLHEGEPPKGDDEQ